MNGKKAKLARRIVNQLRPDLSNDPKYQDHVRKRIQYPDGRVEERKQRVLTNECKRYWQKRAKLEWKKVFGTVSRIMSNNRAQKVFSQITTGHLTGKPQT